MTEAKFDMEMQDVLGSNIVERIGDCSNIEHRVNIDSPLWITIEMRGGLTRQENLIFDIARIVDDNGIQKANGSPDAMQEKMGRLLSGDFLQPGDVIGVSRGVYEHYAIYAGDRKVIHYAGKSAGFMEKESIHEAPFEEFLKDSDDYFVLFFGGRLPVKIHASTKFISDGLRSSCEIRWKSRYTPAETLKRAYSRLGEEKYDIMKNNCEHFVSWCKTGKAESVQVERLIRGVVTGGEYCLAGVLRYL